VMNATVPRPVGPRARVTSNKPRNSPALPTICAQKKRADARAAGSLDGGLDNALPATGLGGEWERRPREC
jgi:hypothetical protein